MHLYGGCCQLARREPECGIAQSSSEKREGATRCEGERNKKNELPGFSASQKSVAEFFNVVNTGGNISTPIPAMDRVVWMQ